MLTVSDVSTYNATVAMKKRALQIQNRCLEAGLLRDGLAKKKLKYLVSDEINLLYCPIPKCGWSTWKYLFYTWKNNGEQMESLRRGWDSEWKYGGLRVATNPKSEHIARFSYRMAFFR